MYLRRDFIDKRSDQRYTCRRYHLAQRKQSMLMYSIYAVSCVTYICTCRNLRTHEEREIGASMTNGALFTAR